MAAARKLMDYVIQPTTLDLLGGRKALLRTGAAVSSFQLKYTAVEHLGRFLGESALNLMRLIESNERTAQRRREQGSLTIEESDRIARIARVTQRAIEAFGDKEQALEWLKRPNRVLQGFAPLGLLVTDAGAVVVTDELGRIEYGELY
jgi:putative toxin-antitoxin system antitoxin component (TIGR02293 family)